QLQEYQRALREQRATIKTFASQVAPTSVTASVAEIVQDLPVALSDLGRAPNPDVPNDLVDGIGTSEDLDHPRIIDLQLQVERLMANPEADKVGIHREIGKAIFARSADLYSGRGLP